MGWGATDLLFFPGLGHYYYYYYYYSGRKLAALEQQYSLPKDTEEPPLAILRSALFLVISGGKLPLQTAPWFDPKNAILA